MQKQERESFTFLLIAIKYEENPFHRLSLKYRRSIALSSALSFPLSCQQLRRQSLSPFLSPSFSPSSPSLSPPVCLSPALSYKYASIQLQTCLSVPGKPKKKRINKAEEGCRHSVVTSQRLWYPWQLGRLKKKALWDVVWEELTNPAHPLLHRNLP